MSIAKSIFIGALALSGAASTALAEPVYHYDPFADDQFVVSVRVQLDGLNLRSYDGANVALDRINHVAKAACGDRPVASEPAFLEKSSRYAACRDHKLRLAVEDTHSRMVERAYAERFGGVFVD